MPRTARTRRHPRRRGSTSVRSASASSRREMTVCRNGRCETRRWVDGREVPSASARRSSPFESVVRPPPPRLFELPLLTPSVRLVKVDGRGTAGECGCTCAECTCSGKRSGSKRSGSKLSGLKRSSPTKHTKRSSPTKRTKRSVSTKRTKRTKRKRSGLSVSTKRKRSVSGRKRSGRSGPRSSRAKYSGRRARRMRRRMRRYRDEYD